MQLDTRTEYNIDRKNCGFTPRRCYTENVDIGKQWSAVKSATLTVLAPRGISTAQ